MSGMFTVNMQDVAKGAITAVLMALVTAAYGITQTPGFNVLAINWQAALPSLINIAFLAFVSYMAKNFLSNSDGAFLGKIGGTPSSVATQTPVV